MTAPQVDTVNNLMTRFNQYEAQVRIERHIASVMTETGSDYPTAYGRPTAADAVLMRGIPIVAVQGGCGGHIRGTQPG